MEFKLFGKTLYVELVDNEEDDIDTGWLERPPKVYPEYRLIGREEAEHDGIARDLYKLNGVQEVYFTECVDWLCCKFKVVGGNLKEIAQVLWNTRPCGVVYEGEISVEVVDYIGTKRSVYLDWEQV